MPGVWPLPAEEQDVQPAYYVQGEPTGHTPIPHAEESYCKLAFYNIGLQFLDQKRQALDITLAELVRNMSRWSVKETFPVTRIQHPSLTINLCEERHPLECI